MRTVPPLLKTLRERGSIELLYILFHLCLSRLGYTPQAREGITLNRVVDSVVSNHVKHVITNKFIIGIPIAVAIFETIIKLYGDDERKIRKAPLGPTLSVFENKVIPHLPQPLQIDIEEINRIIESIWNAYGSNWRKILLNWRNKFMHGAKTWAPKAFAVYTNYICLLLWHSIPCGKYEQKRKEILKAIKWRIHTNVEDYWSFYPPPI